MKKISKLLIHGFIFERKEAFGLYDETKEFNFKGEIIPEYCRITPYQNENGELAINVNIVVKETEEEHECKISIFEANELYVHSLCLENVLFYDIYTNNENGQLEQYHIFVWKDDNE